MLKRKRVERRSGSLPLYFHESNLMSAAISVLKLVIERRGGVLDLQCMLPG
jgi:hypothetical protein